MSYQLELRHLKNFLIVAEELHFRKAADRLFISQPGLSKQIKEIEAHIGATLFERTNRKVELTKAGLFLQQELQQHLTELNHIIKHTKRLHDGLVGDLKLGYVGSAMREIIPNLLVAFRTQYPDVFFSLKEMDNTEQIEGILSREIDLGFVRLERVPRGLNTFPILKEPFCLVLPKDHPIDVHNFKSISQFSNEPFVLFESDSNPSYYERVMQIFDAGGFSPIVRHHTIHANSVYQLVAHNFGISIIPKSLITHHIESIKFIELDMIPQRTTLSVVWNSHSRNPVIHDFLEEVKKIVSI